MSTNSIATKEQLLEYANTVRTAGGTEPITDLLPSSRFTANACLVANAVNFDSIVTVLQPENDHRWVYWPSGNFKWVMKLQDKQLAEQIAKATNQELILTDGGAYYSVVLPEPIGNAAEAFDLGQAFTEYEDV